MSDARKTRVLIAKPGLDGHDRGARVVAYGLRDAGFEVIYTGLRQTPQQIARAAVQEDVQVVGLSILSGSHLSMTADIMDELRSRQAEDICVIVGGVIPEQDIPTLTEMGVRAVFTAGTTIKAMAELIHELVAPQQMSGEEASA